jgi:hypothetical protein
MIDARLVLERMANANQAALPLGVLSHTMAKQKLTTLLILLRMNTLFESERRNIQL